LSLVLLALFWIANSLSQLTWLFVDDQIDVPAPTVVASPVATGSQVVVDLDRMQAWNLFGAADGVIESAVVTAPAVGIEDGAKETRLDLVLVGVLAARSDGLGQAVIQYRQDQTIYRVGDALPVSGRVSLAKVLADRVVLDNNGTYELLRLYDESALAKSLATSTAARAAPARVANEDTRRERTSGQARSERESRLSAAKRDRYYDNPESLAELVSVAAVRGADGALSGYRVAPGAKGDEFAALGFKPGDIVTEVNGLSLSDPGNAVLLYQMLKDAQQANFVIERGGSTMNLSVQVGGERP
jgi:general secretion pathway protein C